MTKHKHADIIHAWADGAEIQVKSNDEWWDCQDPFWELTHEYRIKPNACQCMTREEKKPVVRWLWAYYISSGGYELTSFLTEREALQYPLEVIKLEWSRTEFPE